MAYDKDHPPTWLCAECLEQWALAHSHEAKGPYQVNELTCSCGQLVVFNPTNSTTPIICKCSKQYMPNYYGATELPVIYNEKTETWQSVTGKGHTSKE